MIKIARWVTLLLLALRVAMRSLMALLLLLVLGGPVRADWPMARHDPQRTGLATGHSNLQTPGAYWRYYLGGRLDSGRRTILGHRRRWA